MREFLRKILIIPLLVMFVINVSGLSICLEHSQHSSSISTKLNPNKKETCIDNDDDFCHCLLHMDMNSQVLMSEILVISTPTNSLVEKEMPQPKAITYRCLLDFFSSRAPPYLT